MIDFAKYLFEHPGSVFGWGLIIFFVFYGLGYMGRDDTDSKLTKKRSGMVLYTDYGTGCQYVRAGFLSGLQPRLDAKGNHICVGKEDS